MVDHVNLRTTSWKKRQFEYKSPSIDRGSVEAFHESNSSWSKNNMYRTSYTDMKNGDPKLKRGFVVPKY